MLETKVEQYFKNPRKIIDVKAEENYVLCLTFDNGEVKFYDMSDKLQGIFSILKNKEKFEAVFLDEFGNVAWDIDENVSGSECWNNRIDLCKDALYMDGTNERL